MKRSSFTCSLRITQASLGPSPGAIGKPRTPINPAVGKNMKEWKNINFWRWISNTCQSYIEVDLSPLHRLAKWVGLQSATPKADWIHCVECHLCWFTATKAGELRTSWLPTVLRLSLLPLQDRLALIGMAGTDISGLMTKKLFNLMLAQGFLFQSILELNSQEIPDIHF